MSAQPIKAAYQDHLSERDHKRVARFIEHIAGIQLPAAKRSLIEGRLRKRQRALGHKSLHSYIDYALDSEAGKVERIQLLDAITTNKTDFYREPDHFQVLRQHVLSELARERDRGWKQPLRVWSAGCSSGEEPYTLAIEMLELRQQLPGLRFEILATDISVSSLDTAKRATYPHNRIEVMPMDLRRKYLMRSRKPEQNLVRMAPEVRKPVTFRSFNLLTDAYDFPARFDVIFCRNVMIYFNNDDKAQIVGRFSHKLVAGGLLFIGHSETLSCHGDLLQQVKPTVYRRVAGGR